MAGGLPGQREEPVQADRVGEVPEPGGGGEGEHQRQAEGQAARGGRAVGRRPGDQRRRYAQPGGDQQHDRGEVSRRAQRGEQVPRQRALRRGADAGQAERIRQRVLDQRGRGGHGGGGQARGQDGGGADRRGREPGGAAGAVPGGDHGRQHRHGGPGGVLHRAGHADRDGGGARAGSQPGAGAGRGTGAARAGAGGAGQQGQGEARQRQHRRVGDALGQREGQHRGGHGERGEAQRSAGPGAFTPRDPERRGQQQGGGHGEPWPRVAGQARHAERP